MERILYGTVGWGRESSVGKGEGRGLDEEGEITREEAIERLKVGKVAGVNGLGNELWKFGGREVKK